MNREKMIEAITTAILGKTAPKAAADVLDLCWPEKLVWQRNGQHWACGRDGLVIRMQSANRFVLTRRNAFDQIFDTLEAAQAAAQSLADATHWGNTAIKGPAND